MGRRSRGRRRRGPYQLGAGSTADDGDGLSRFAAVRADAERREILAAHPRLQDAAAVAELFSLDPVAVLAEPDRFKRDVRLAAALTVHHERVRAKARDDAAVEAATRTGRRHG